MTKSFNKVPSEAAVQFSPKISVVIPSYNQADFIERTLLSVLHQGYPNLELIVVDGGSTDGTLSILERYRSSITHIISERDDGQSDALNKGFSLATGDIFGWLNSDDLYLPESFSRVVRAFDGDPARLVVYGDWLYVDINDRVIRRETALPFSLGQLKYEGFHANAQSMFWRKEVHQEFGQFNTRLHRTMDYEMILRFGHLAGEGAFHLIPEPLGCFRCHAGQKTQGFDATVIAEQRRIAEEFGYSDKYRWPGKVKRLCYRCRRFYWYLRRGVLGRILVGRLR